jgi:hypothetical protein
VVIEAGVVAGYLSAWAIRKARRVGERLDRESDAAIDGGLDRLHEVVAAKLAGHPALAELVEEAQSAGDGDLVPANIRSQVELALEWAAGKDDAFRQAVTELVARLRAAEEAAGHPVTAGPGSPVFTGDAGPGPPGPGGPGPPRSAGRPERASSTGPRPLP